MSLEMTAGFAVAFRVAVVLYAFCFVSVAGSLVCGFLRSRKT